MFKKLLVMMSLVSIYASQLSQAEEVADFNHSESQHLTSETVSVGSGKIEQYKIYLGKINVNPNKSSHFNPRYPGVVQSVYKSVGDQVKAGQVLARIANNVGVQTYSMKTGLAGTVIHRKLAVGEFVDEERLAFSVADLNTMWVDITIRQSDLKFFKKDQQVIILNRANNGEHTTGNIFYISPTVDQNTMSATATVEINNSENSWKPGQYVDSYIVVAKKNYNLTVDNSALVEFENETYAYIKKGGGETVRTKVKTGLKDLHKTQILDGLKKGDQVILVANLSISDIKVEADKEDLHGEEGHKDGEEEHKN